MVINLVHNQNNNGQFSHSLAFLNNFWLILVHVHQSKANMVHFDALAMAVAGDSGIEKGNVAADDVSSIC